MHNQHRSPDPTKIERATATSTVALFYFAFLQSVSIVDGATHTQKDDVESNGGSLENVATVFVPFLCGVQLVLMSGVLTVLGLNEVDVASSFVEVFWSVLSGVGGCTSGWRCC